MSSPAPSGRASRLIKAGQAPGARAATLGAPLHEAKLEAARRISEAEAQAARVLADAEQTAAAVRQAASADGREQGLAKTTELVVAARAAAARVRAGAERDI